MVFFNWATMQMAAKIVYYGPGLCGKTSNLSYIYAKTSPESRGEMVSLETESDRTLFFDLLPIEVGTIGGFKTRLQLYTVPGQVFYNTTRKLVLKGVDGLVFVADSQRPMREANIESFKSLAENLEEFGLEVSEVPIVLQYNKRDLSNILTIEELNADLNPDGSLKFQEASAVNGDGVITTLKEITKLTLKKLKVRMTAPEGSTTTTKIAAPSVRPVKPPQPAPPISARSLARAAEEGAGFKLRRPRVNPTPGAAPTVNRGRTAYHPRPSSISQTKTSSYPLNPGNPPPQRTKSWSRRRRYGRRRHGAAISRRRGHKDQRAGCQGGRQRRKRTRYHRGRVRRGNEPLPSRPSRQRSSGSRSRTRWTSSPSSTASENKRRWASAVGSAETSASDLDLDSLISGDTGQSRELRRKIEKAVNSDIFKTMRGMQIAIRIQNESGDTIHSFDPVSVDIEDATTLKKLCLRFSLDLENLR